MGLTPLLNRQIANLATSTPSRAAPDDPDCVAFWIDVKGHFVYVLQSKGQITFPLSAFGTLMSAARIPDAEEMVVASTVRRKLELIFGDKVVP
ncbi:hypothetical protein [Mycobacterium hippophais]|uniref:hypothetical protein n=1 Tax=Mycobacterium hippophais TaxID=3016340 RepID=UPI0022B8A8B7|nr:hypothetical protein [Mycobacterium hippophais]